jgi:predicted kinase
MVVIVGPPGSGKTSLAKKWPGYIVFDNDRVIEAVWGSLQFHANIKRMAKGMVREGIRRAMEAGLAMVVPISGRNKKERGRVIDIARESGYHVTVVRAVATPEECLARCKADPTRPKSTDWQPIIERWIRVYEAPDSNECDEYQEMRSDGL